MKRRSFLSGLLAATALSAVPVPLKALAAPEPQIVGSSFGGGISAREAGALYARLTAYLDQLYIFAAPTEEEAMTNVLQSEEVFSKTLDSRPALVSFCTPIIPRFAARQGMAVRTARHGKYDADIAFTSPYLA